MNNPLSCTVAELCSTAGYVPHKANLVAMLVNCAVETLGFAEQALESGWGEFCQKKKALRDSPVRSPKGRVLRPDENAMTYEVGEYVDHYFRALPPTHPYRSIKFQYEKPLPSKKLAGNSQKSMDMRYSVNFLGGPELVIEAKPLYDEADIAPRYLGDEGIERFTRADEPYTQEEIGAMLGYVESSQHEAWKHRIRDALENHTPCQMVVDVGLPSWNPLVTGTSHARAHRGDSIWLLHFLLKYPTPILPAIPK